MRVRRSPAAVSSRVEPHRITSLCIAIGAWEDREETSKPEDLPNHYKIGTAFEEKAPGDRWLPTSFALFVSSWLLPILRLEVITKNNINMVKKLLTIVMGLGLAMSASATINFSASDIQYWVGTGSNQAVVVIAWDDCTPATALAWGVRWNGTTTALGLIDSIQAHDSRFSNGSTATVQGAVYNDGTLILSSLTNWWCYQVNGEWASVGYSGYTMSDGDFMELSATCDFDMTTAIAATDPNPNATPEEATIAASDILYWVGEGANQVVMAVNWPDTALAWGYRFDGTKSVSDMMNDIAAADPRFSIVPGSYGIDDILFVENGDTLRRLPASWWGSTNNGVMDAGMGQALANGDFEKWAESSTGILVDSTWVDEWGGYWNYNYVYPMTIHPVSAPAPEEATISANAIEYWVGEGSNEAILVVNWASTALAWGYRWSNDATVADLMEDIAAADPRFSYTMNGTYLGDILYVATAGDTLRGTSWWECSLYNGMAQTLANGDLVKWADPAAGVIADSVYYDGWGWSYIYVYPMEISAATQPMGSGPFCGIVGTEGCTAIAADNSAILGWATACTIVRGSQNLTNPEAPAVTYGAENDAVGAATNNTMDVVSLGDGGSATLTFERPIANGEGPDFAVFENSFDDYFLELAFVEVSSDGERFVRFPATSLTQTETQTGSSGSTDPTRINNLAGKFRIGYGTPFDLDELSDSTGINLDSIVYVRIVDVVGSIDPQYATYDAFGHIVNDPWPTNFGSCGFDLTGVAVLNEYVAPQPIGIKETEFAIESVWPNPTADRVNVAISKSANAQLFDLTGRQLGTYSLQQGTNTIDLSIFPEGVYMLRIEGTACKIVRKR